MTELRQYLLSVICVCLICAILPMFAGSTGKQILRLICGVFLTVTVVSPILRVEVEPLLESLLPQQTREEIVSQGQTHARDSMAAIIKSETEAYILDKARLLGLELSVTVLLGPDEIPVPEGAILEGTASQEQKAQLAEILTVDLGIPKEAQKWISG